MAVLISRGDRGTLEGVWVPFSLDGCPARLQWPGLRCCWLIKRRGGWLAASNGGGYNGGQ